MAIERPHILKKLTFFHYYMGHKSSPTRRLGLFIGTHNPPRAADGRLVVTA